MTKFKYTPTLHAIERARHRFGVKSTEAMRWFNDIMRESKYIVSQRSQMVYEHESGNIRIVVDPENKTIITVMPNIDLSELKPIFERELRKLEREVKRNCRTLERTKAETIIHYGNLLLNKANARNPKVRDVIQRKIDEAKARIDEIDVKMNREQDRLENFTKAVRLYD